MTGGLPAALVDQPSGVDVELCAVPGYPCESTTRTAHVRIRPHPDGPPMHACWYHLGFAVALTLDEIALDPSRQPQEPRP